MIRIVALDIPDRLGGIADRLLERLREELEAADQLPTSGASETEPNSASAPLTNKHKVEALQRRCTRINRTVKTADVALVADVDESEFFKWQRGAYVGRNTRRKCDDAVNLSAEEFLRRLDALASETSTV